MQCRPLGRTEPDPAAADTLKSLKGNPTAGALGLGDNPLADPVVYVSYKPRFSSSSLSK
jgi:hypothetical protein